MDSSEAIHRASHDLRWGVDLEDERSEGEKKRHPLAVTYPVRVFCEHMDRGSINMYATLREMAEDPNRFKCEHAEVGENSDGRRCKKTGEGCGVYSAIRESFGVSD